MDYLTMTYCSNLTPIKVDSQYRQIDRFIYLTNTINNELYLNTGYDYYDSYD